MLTTFTKEDRDFLVRFLDVYTKLNDRNKDIVLAFTMGLECQNTLQKTGPAVSATG